MVPLFVLLKSTGYLSQQMLLLLPINHIKEVKLESQTTNFNNIFEKKYYGYYYKAWSEMKKGWALALVRISTLYLV